MRSRHGNRRGSPVPEYPASPTRGEFLGEPCSFLTKQEGKHSHERDHDNELHEEGASLAKSPMCCVRNGQRLLTSNQLLTTQRLIGMRSMPHSDRCTVLSWQWFPNCRGRLHSPWKTTRRTERCEMCSLSSEIGLPNAYSVSHLIALYRIAWTEATRHSGIGREFFEQGPGKLTMCLAEYLERSTRRFNQFRIDNPKCIADNFLSLLIENLDLSDAITATRTSSAKDHNDAVIEAVELFCHGIVTEGQQC